MVQAQSNFAPTAKFETCFTPGGQCEDLIATTIRAAKRQILVQAYQFTSKKIAEALVEAQGKGLKIRVILDRSQRSDRYTILTFLQNAKIDTRIDDSVAIAHNKVIAIDGETLITGSFNFTNSAQTRNAENLLVIQGQKDLVDIYEMNFEARWKASR